MPRRLIPGLEKPPKLAFRTEQAGEGECAVPPVLIHRTGEWVPLEGGGNDCMMLDRTGDWLLVSSVVGDWTLFDLTLGAEAGSGPAFARFWPADLDVPQPSTD